MLTLYADQVLEVQHALQGEVQRALQCEVQRALQCEVQRARLELHNETIATSEFRDLEFVLTFASAERT